MFCSNSVKGTDDGARSFISSGWCILSQGEAFTPWGILGAIGDTVNLWSTIFDHWLRPRDRGRWMKPMDTTMVVRVALARATRMLDSSSTTLGLSPKAESTIGPMFRMLSTFCIAKLQLLLVPTFCIS